MMKQTFSKIAWIILYLTPILFWLEIYWSWTTEYDENWAHFFRATFISLLAVGLLFLTRIKDKKIINFQIITKIIIFLFSSPLTIFAIVIYSMIFSFQWKWSGSHVENGKSYSDIKKRNYFKAENYLILDNLTTNADTIKTVVSRDGEIEKIVRLKGGQEIELSNSFLNSLTDKQRKNLSEY